MSITLAVGATTVTLPENFYWADENWAPVVQTASPSITGSMIVMAGALVGGRPITLQPFENAAGGWTLLSALTQLRAWAAVAGQEMTLTLRGTAYTVLWRHQDTAIEAAPVFHYTDVDGADWYVVTLRFMVKEA
ncbi:MAG: hypothetical protein ACSLE9_06810 [Burkholderiaceae bacterium]